MTIAVTGAGSHSRLTQAPGSEATESFAIRLGDGAGTASRNAAEPFFTLRFRAAAPADSGPAAADIALAALDRSCLGLHWTGPATVMRESAAGIGLVASADHVVAHARETVRPQVDLANVASSIYRRLLRRVRALGYPCLVRIWNFVPDMNARLGGEDNYLRFNRGRAAAFDELSVPVAKYPAATVVGSAPGTPFTVIALASRAEPLPVENPRQISAYHYPARYGLHSPAFARAMLLPHRAGATLFVSGTASIVGHESRHRLIEAQLEEALANLETLQAAACAQLPGGSTRSKGSWLVYLRHPEDRGKIAERVRQRLGGSDAVAFLQGDICRRELLVEIEGVCELSR